MEKTDRRVQKTRQAIFDAFDRLIVKRNYAKISIQNIIDEANIGRSTFYDHFETKDELLRTKCTDLFDHIFSPHGSEETHSFSPKSTFAQKITHILYHLLDDKKVIKGILASESGDLFLQYFRQYLTETVRDAKTTLIFIPQDFLQNHISGSFIETVRWWVKRNFKDTPEELAKYYLCVVPFIAAPEETAQ